MFQHFYQLYHRSRAHHNSGRLECFSLLNRKTNVRTRDGLGLEIANLTVIVESGTTTRESEIRFNKVQFFKPYVSPVQIKTEYQNAKALKIDCVSNEEVAAEVGPDSNSTCSQFTYAAYIRNAKERILERQKKESNQRMIKTTSKIIKLQIKYFLI